MAPEKVITDRSSDEGTLNDDRIHSEKPHASKLAALERPAPGQHGHTVKQTALEAELFPVDGFVQQADGSHVFWGDLPAKERRSFMFSQYGDLTRRELAVVGAQFRNDPLSPFVSYWQKRVRIRAPRL